MYINDYESPLGRLVMTGGEEGLTGLWFETGSRFTFPDLQKDAVRRETDCFDQTKHWLDLYFSGRDPGFFPKLNLSGSGFQTHVWDILCEIPFGRTVTYGWIAEQIAKMHGIERMSAQAVGGAVGRNPVCIIVPCHRVVGAGRKLTGYGAGLPRKKALLALEGIDISRFR